MKPQDGDENLMANVAQGQRAPLEVLVRRHGSALLTFIRRMVGDPHRSEELFQDVFRVWQGRSYAEIADLRSVTEAPVRSHMHHALVALHKYLDPVNPTRERGID